MTHASKRATMVLLGLTLFSCQDQGMETLPLKTVLVSNDQQLFALIVHEQQSAPYALFPNADSITSGTLRGSGAHQPEVRVSMNPTVFGALGNGQLPAGSSFPDGAVIIKEIRINGQTNLYAVVYKEKNNPRGSGGWLWAEFNPDGTAAVSIADRGSVCINCHADEQGTAHDYIRTFERQLP